MHKLVQIKVNALNAWIGKLREETLCRFGEGENETFHGNVDDWSPMLKKIQQDLCGIKHSLLGFDYVGVVQKDIDMIDKHAQVLLEMRKFDCPEGFHLLPNRDANVYLAINAADEACYYLNECICHHCKTSSSNDVLKIYKDYIVAVQLWLMAFSDFVASEHDAPPEVWQRRKEDDEDSACGNTGPEGC